MIEADRDNSARRVTRPRQQQQQHLSSKTDAQNQLLSHAPSRPLLHCLTVLIQWFPLTAATALLLEDIVCRWHVMTRMRSPYYEILRTISLKWAAINNDSVQPPRVHCSRTWSIFKNSSLESYIYIKKRTLMREHRPNIQFLGTFDGSQRQCGLLLIRTEILPLGRWIGNSSWQQLDILS